MVEKLLAGLGLAACLLLLGMALGPRRRQRLRARADRLLHWRRDRGQARREAERAIERAKRKVAREGNVYRPDAFGGGNKRPPDEPLH